VHSPASDAQIRRLRVHQTNAFELFALGCFLASAAGGADGNLDANRLKQGNFQYRTLLGGKDAGEDVLTIKKNSVSGIFEFSDSVSGAFSQQWEATTTAAFKPISARLSFGEGSERRPAFDFTYAEGRAKGTTRAKGQQQQRGTGPFDLPVPADVVDQRIDWASVMSLDLIAGRHFEYHVFDPGSGVSRISGQISGPEKISVPAGSFDAMRIVYQIEKTNAVETYQVLTNARGPRMLLREEFPNGAVTDLLRVWMSKR
jgi:hypothetical protein